MEARDPPSSAQFEVNALEARFEVATDAVRDAGRRKRQAAKAFNPLRQGGAPLDAAFLATMKAWVQADIDLRSAIEQRLQARDAWMDLWAAQKAQEALVVGPRTITRNPALAAWARATLGTQAPKGEQLRIVPASRAETNLQSDLER